MKILKPILCCLLAVLMLLPLLVACKTDEQLPEDSDSDVVSESESETEKPLEYDEKGFLKDDLGKKDFNNREIRIMAWQLSHLDFTVKSEDMNKSVLHQAVYLRNSAVEKRLNVKLKFDIIAGTSANTAGHNTYLKEAEIRQSTNAVDIFAAYSRNAATLMSRGYTADLLQVENLDFSKPWWAKGLVDKSTIYDRLYFASGDISPSVIFQTYVISFDKDMAEIYFPERLNQTGYDSIYDMVEDGAWTIDNLILFCKGVGFEDGDGIYDSKDTVGFTSSNIYLDAFYQGSGLTSLAYNDDGSIKISEDMYSDKTISLVEKISAFIKSSDCALHGENLKINDLVLNDGVLFALMTTATIPGYVQMGAKLGILPVPKYDALQENYVSTHAFPCTYWSISRNVTDESDCMGAVLECLASEGYRSTTPALFEDMLRVKSSDSPEDYKMWGVIRDNLSFDGGRVYSDMFEGWTWGVFRNAVLSISTDYMSGYKSAEATLQGGALSLNNLMYQIERIYGDEG